MGRTFTIAKLEVTPRCQEVHNGLTGAILEAARRAAVHAEFLAKKECNAGAHWHVIVEMERKA